MIRDTEYKKPPIGLVPKFIRDKERMLEILEAIGRYYNADVEIPQEWINELSELNRQMFKNKRV